MLYSYKILQKRAAVITARENGGNRRTSHYGRRDPFLALATFCVNDGAEKV